jgi:flagellar motility protein MotE (MotC chaperone)
MAGKSFGRKNGRGSVVLICSLLLGSAAIRLGSEAGKAVATENPSPVPVATQTNVPASEDAENVSEMLRAFQQREARIARLERELEVRAQALRVADEQIEQRLQVLKSAEDSLREMLAIADTAAENDVAALTSVYENMKAKDAATLFEEMDPNFAAGFLARMRPAAAAGIMAGLTPQKAYTISVILAGRNAQAPKG